MKILFNILRKIFIMIVFLTNDYSHTSVPVEMLNSERSIITNLSVKFAIMRERSAEMDEFIGAYANEVRIPTFDPIAFQASLRKKNRFAYANPAGCAAAMPTDLTPDNLLANVQVQLGNRIDLYEAKQTYIWNGSLNTMLDVTDDPFVYEFVINDFAPPLTYLGDEIATIFLVNGFTVWFRSYGGNFRLIAIPMTAGVLDSRWAEYVTAYWQPGGQPNDETILPVMKKLPCHWVMEAGYVSNETVKEMILLDWHIPDYLTSGRQYLAQDCQEAYRISQEEIDFWSATSMCGPLTWTLMKDVNGFPYRIGSWYSSHAAFENANPRWNAQPWASFDPDLFDLISTDMPLAGHDFANLGELYPGDVIYSFSTLYYEPDDQHFDHIFLVAGIGENDSRISISNMVQNYPFADCSISEVVLYTPGDRLNGVVNHEWNGFGFGKTGGTGFDIFRWNWITYHINGQSINYDVRWGDTVETIAFDWKIDPQSILSENHFKQGVQLAPGQIIVLPAPTGFNTENAQLAFKNN